MTRLGDGNVLARLFGTLHGWLRAPRHDPRPSRRPHVVAHRGAARFAPENTVAAFRTAAELGADAIETDVCATSDGHFVLWHDPDPDGPVALVRQTTGEGMGLLGGIRVANIGSRLRRKPGDLTLSELRENFGYVTKGDSGDRPDVPIALLVELLDWLATDDRIREVFLDIKLGPNEAHQLPGLFDLLLRRFPEEAPKALHFNLLLPERELAETAIEEHRRRGAPARVRVWGDFEWPGALPVSRDLGLRRVSMGKGQRSWADLRQELDRVVDARNAGELDGVLVWTFDEPAQLEELAGLGLDGILTNDPATLRRIASEIPAAPS